MTSRQISNPWTGRWKTALVLVLMLQGLAAIGIGTSQWLTNDAQGPLAPIALTAIVPVLLFLAAYGLSEGFRAFVLAQDLRLLTMMQHWRVIGFGFLLLYAHGTLPTVFAWPAGVGDFAIGLAAIWVVARIDRDPDFVTSSGFVRFHLLGLLDFAVAVITAGLTAGAFPGLLFGSATSAPMDVWPLNVFPSFLVPAFIILHLTVLLKVAHLRRESRNHVTLQTA